MFFSQGYTPHMSHQEHHIPSQNTSWLTGFLPRVMIIPNNPGSLIPCLMAHTFHFSITHMYHPIVPIMLTSEPA